mmetsp:Transcript_14291/g.37520  ORF Transcript_14291/g.37520 Transcript_14291/m.37520 type:complete len:209 (+) Transcript_14291:897-1523(+)
MLGDAPRRLHQHVPARVRVGLRVRPERIGGGPARGLGVAQHVSERTAIEPLARAEHLAKGRLGCGHDRTRRSEIARRKERNLPPSWCSRERQRDLSDHAEGALRPDEELLQVGPGIVLTHARAETQHAPAPVHDGQRQHVRAERSMPHEPHAARMRRQVAANLARALRAQIQRHLVAQLVARCVELLEDAPRAAGQHALERVEVVHRV